MLQLAHAALALHVVLFQPVDHRHQLRRHARDLREQQVRLVRMVAALGEFVDVEQHRAQHVEEALGLLVGAAFEHLQQRAQDGRDGGMLVADHLQGGSGRHGRSPGGRFASRPQEGIDLRQRDRSRQRFSSSALVSTLTLDIAIAAPATTGLR